MSSPTGRNVLAAIKLRVTNIGDIGNIVLIVK